MEPESSPPKNTKSEENPSDTIHPAPEPVSEEDRNVPVQPAASANCGQSVESTPKKMEKSNSDQFNSNQVCGKRGYDSTPSKETDTIEEETNTPKRPRLEDDSNSHVTPTKPSEQRADGQSHTVPSPQNLNAPSSVKKRSIHRSNPNLAVRSIIFAGQQPRPSSCATIDCSTINPSASRPIHRLMANEGTVVGTTQNDAADAANLDGHDVIISGQDPSSQSTSQDNFLSETIQHNPPTMRVNLGNPRAGIVRCSRRSTSFDWDDTRINIDEQSPSLISTSQGNLPSSSSRQDRQSVRINIGHPRVQYTKKGSCDEEEVLLVGISQHEPPSTSAAVLNPRIGQIRDSSFASDLDGSRPSTSAGKSSTSRGKPSKSPSLSLKYSNASTDELTPIVHDRGLRAVIWRWLEKTFLVWIILLIVAICVFFASLAPLGVVQWPINFAMLVLFIVLMLVVSNIIHCIIQYIPGKTELIPQSPEEELAVQARQLIQNWGRFYIAEQELLRRLDCQNLNEFNQAIEILQQRDEVHVQLSKGARFYSWVSRNPLPPKAKDETKCIMIRGIGLGELDRSALDLSLRDRMNQSAVTPRRLDFDRFPGIVFITFKDKLDASAAFNELHRQFVSGIQVDAEFV